MSSNRNAADHQTFGEAFWLTATGTAALVMLAGALVGQLELYLVVAIAFGLGAAFAGSLFYFAVYRPLFLAAGACRQVQSGNLSHTVPEVGPPPLREMARTTNNMAADFQEILLLFAHLARSAERSAQLLMTHTARVGISETDRQRAAEIIEDVHEMQEMIQEFKYFRVRFVDGRIIDGGIPSRSPQGDGGIPDELATMFESRGAAAPEAMAPEVTPISLATVSEGEK